MSNFEKIYEENFVVEITEEDLAITEKWLVKVSILAEEKEDTEEDDGLVSRKLVFELIQRFAPLEEMVLGFEVSKLPVLNLNDIFRERLGETGKIEFFMQKGEDDSSFHYVKKKILSGNG